jgi:hypothetical protein
MLTGMRARMANDTDADEEEEASQSDDGSTQYVED